MKSENERVKLFFANNTTQISFTISSLLYVIESKVHTRNANTVE